MDGWWEDNCPCEGVNFGCSQWPGQVAFTYEYHEEINRVFLESYVYVEVGVDAVLQVSFRAILGYCESFSRLVLCRQSTSVCIDSTPVSPSAPTLPFPNLPCVQSTQKIYSVRHDI